MKNKRIAAFAASAAGLLLICAIIAILLSQSGAAPRTEVPEFVLPESLTQDASGSDAFSQTSRPVDSSDPESGKTHHDSSEVPPNDPVSDTSETQPDTSQAASITSGTESVIQPAESSAITSTAATDQTKPPHTTTANTAATLPPDSSEQEELPDNVMVTSCDPLHYIRFEFQPDKVLLSGVYTGNDIYRIYVLRTSAECYDLAASGNRFSGSIDVSPLDTGYYIIRVKLDSGAVMDYVFEMTEHGARSVPEDLLPAEKNLAFTDAALEIPAENVMQYVTLSGDPQKADEILRQVKELSDMICSGITDDFSKARTLADWVSHNIYYDKDASEKGVADEELTLEFLLEYHRSVCFGWSNLYSALCQAQGIECYNAIGSVVTGSRCFPQTELSDERSHSWNMVVIDGEKLWVDTVWNSANTFEYGSYNEGSTKFQYFGIDNELLSHDHRVSRFEYRDYFG